MVKYSSGLYTATGSMAACLTLVTTTSDLGRRGPRVASVRSVLSSWPRRVAGSEVGLGSHMTGWAGRGTYTRKFEAPPQ